MVMLMLGCDVGIAADVFAASEAGMPSEETTQRVEKLAASIADELSTRCPIANQADQLAYDKCRLSLYRDSLTRRALAPIVAWGRPAKSSPTALLKETTLTQFAPDALTSMYLPLFMFNGKYTVEYIAREKLFLVKLGAGFRNRLAPGQFPYPFWHDSVKWNDYEKANTIQLWIHPEKNEIRFAQFSAIGETDPQLKTTPVEPPIFDGKWVWTDAFGKTQPIVTMFDGIFSRDNPHLKDVDTTYKQLALKMRDGQCDSCHVPNNPDKMKRLVLLQTPAHAAAEIKRLLKSVREDRMPLDEMGLEKPMDASLKSALLTSGVAFDAALDQARLWEKQKNAPRVQRGNY